MTKIDLNKMSLEELTQLIEEAKVVQAKKQDERRGEFMDEMQARAASLGFDLAQMFGGVRRTKSNSKAPKSTNRLRYVDPANPANVYYLSRGKKPRWLQAYLDDGRKLEEFAA